MSNDIKPASKRQARYRRTQKGKEYMQRDNDKRILSKYLWKLRHRMEIKRQKIAELKEMI